MLKDRILVFIRYAMFWLLFFVAQRAVFLTYNFTFTSKLSLFEAIKTFTSGFKLDLSITGYLLMVVALLMGILFFLKGKALARVLFVFTAMFLLLFSVIAFVDIELYRNWGFRIDNTVLLYITSPKEAMASTSIWLTAALVLATGLYYWLFVFIYKKMVQKQVLALKRGHWISLPVFILLSGTMIIPMRGGLGIAPINVGVVYFSQKPFANHAAVNVQWNFLKSVSEINNKPAIHYMDTEEAEQKVQALYNSGQKANSTFVRSFVRSKNPNVVIIILESFSSRIIEPLGGMKDVTPNFNQLIHQGVLFSNFHANGDRSDKGIVSILSGYPAQSTTSIIKYNAKAEKLPHISIELKKRGYNTAFYYGGEIDFANMRSYFVTGGYQNLVTLDEFSGNELNSKWGAHDHVVFQRFLGDLNHTPPPFFNVMFTLSSHEPFDVPFTSKFNENNEDSKFLNSACYTDSCLGDFINKAQQQPWWDNTLVLLVADHGGRLPGNVAYHSKTKFEIPLLMLGGALAVKDTVIDKYACQTDIANIIGNQLEAPFNAFAFSKQKNSQPFAFFAFNNGFGFYKSDSAGFIMNNEPKKTVDKTIGLDTLTQQQGKAFMQALIDDFNQK